MNDTICKSHLPFKFKVEKANNGDMTFSAYANVKNVKDHAWDIAVDGCYQKSINAHKEKGTMPKLLWSHDPYQPPVGKITDMEEDEYGLKIDGRLSKTDRGIEIYELAKDGSLDSFSIGYIEVESQWNNEAKANMLVEIDVKEVSFVNFPCNEASTLQAIKMHLKDGELPTQRELQKFLQENGLSRSQASKIADCYSPEEHHEKNSLNVDDFVAELDLFS